MDFIIYDKDGNLINIIYASIDFVKNYCSNMGYTYKEYEVDELTTQELINQFKLELESTDYKIIKCNEYQLAGLELPYDIVSLHAERQALRDKINELESY